MSDIAPEQAATEAEEATAATPKKRSGRLPAGAFADASDELPTKLWTAPDGETEKDWEHFELWERVVETLYALPSYFAVEGTLPIIPAADLHSANTLLGAVIEDAIPKTLNQLRTLWDPDREYSAYSFQRQPQTFPDVPFRKLSGRPETLFGIEVKSWYVLAKEAEPSFRFYVNRNFCHPADVCVIVPWALDGAVSGKPVVFRPLLCGARKAARLRNESWVGKASDKHWAEIIKPTGPFRFNPTREDRINDSAPRDSGNNMGRLARTGVWQEDIERLLAEERISGIPLAAWAAFLSAFKEATTLDQSLVAVRRIAAKFGHAAGRVDPAVAKIIEGISELSTDD